MFTVQYGNASIFQLLKHSLAASRGRLPSALAKLSKYVQVLADDTDALSEPAAIIRGDGM